MNNQYAEETQNILHDANTEACDHGDTHVGIEHLLIALMKALDPEVTDTLERLCINLPTIVSETEARTRRPGDAVTLRKLPYVSKMETVLRLAEEEALREEHTRMRPHHLLLALLRTETGVPAEVFAKLGMTYDETRRAVSGIGYPETMHVARGNYLLTTHRVDDLESLISAIRRLSQRQLDITAIMVMGTEKK